MALSPEASPMNSETILPGRRDLGTEFWANEAELISKTAQKEIIDFFIFKILFFKNNQKVKIVFGKSRNEYLFFNFYSSG